MSQSMRSALEELGRVFGDPTGPVALYDDLVDPGDPFELGAALSVGHEGTSLLVSYNPRIRSSAPRTRMVATLRRLGIDPRATLAVLACVPVQRASVVLGVEWASGRVPGATLYLEEVARFHDASAIRAIEHDLERLAGVSRGHESNEPGEPYIWALDLKAGSSRPSAFKIYRRTSDTALAIACARRFVGVPLDERLERVWTGGVAPSSWIVQRRFAAGAEPRLKIYKTYDYESHPSAEADAEVRGMLGWVELDEPARVALAILRGDATSCGVSLRAGTGTAQSVTAYWRLRGR